MLKIDVSTIAAQIVKHELISKGRENEALYLNFNLSMSHHTHEHSYNQNRGLHLLYHCHPKGTYITVFSAVTSSSFAKIQEVSEWKHEATHDSGWRDIHTFSQVYFDMAEKINAAMKNDGYVKIPPKDMHEYHSFGLRDNLYQWVPVKITKDPDDDYNYRRLIQVL